MGPLPANGLFVVRGEVGTLVTALRRTSTRWPSSHASDTEDDYQMRSFCELKELLNGAWDLRSIPVVVWLAPFLDLIKSMEITGPVTSLALTAVNKFLTYGLISAGAEDRKQLAAIVFSIADAVTHARFVSTDQTADDVVLLRVLQVLRTLTLAPEGVSLTDESLCEIMLSCFRLCFEIRINELLRRTAEHCLKDMVQLIFMRLPHLQWHLNTTFNDSNQFRMRRTGVSTTSTLANMPASKQRFKGSAKKTPTNSTQDVRVTPSMNDSKQTPSTLNCTQKFVRTNNNLVPHHQQHLSTTPHTPANNIVDIQGCSTNMTDLNTPPTSITDEPRCNLKCSVPNVMEENLESAPDTHVPETEINANNFPLKSEPKAKGITLEGSSERMSGDEEEFTTDDEFVAYGVGCVQELFRFLIGLCNALDKQNTDVMIHLGLTLLTVAFEVGADSIAQHEPLMALVKDDLCRNLFGLLSKNDRISVFAADLHLCFLLFEALRTPLKYQLEFYLCQLIDIIGWELPNAQSSGNSPSIRYTQDHKVLAIDNIVQLWRLPGLIAELYVNFDCSMYCVNAFESISKLLVNIAFPLGAAQYHYPAVHASMGATVATATMQALALDALLTAVDGIEWRCCRTDGHDKTIKTHSLAGSHVEPVTAAIESSDNEETRRQGMNIMPYATSHQRWSDFLTDVDQLPHTKDLLIIRNIKRWLPAGTELFNQKPKKGIQFLEEHGVLDSPLVPQQVAQFLRENGQLDKRMMGEYLSNRSNLEILDAFVHTFDFSGMRIDEALRHYLETFRLPGESPTISLLLEHFIEHWHSSNGEPFADNDSAFTLAYAIIMLNVDQHNENAKKQKSPMSLEGFKKNLKGVNGNGDFDDQLLDAIYHSIKNDEIVMPAEQTGPIRDNYLWKVLLRKSGAGDTNSNGQRSRGAMIRYDGARYDKQLFEILWPHLARALYFVFDKSPNKRLYRRVFQGYLKCATICHHFQLTQHMDALLLPLCKFSTFQSFYQYGHRQTWPTKPPINDSTNNCTETASSVATSTTASRPLSPGVSDAVSVTGTREDGGVPPLPLAKLMHDYSLKNLYTVVAAFGSNSKAQLAVRGVFIMCHKFGDSVSVASWRAIFDMLFSLYCAKLLPKMFTEVEDFSTPNGKTQLLYTSQNRAKSKSGNNKDSLFSSLYSYVMSSAGATGGVNGSEVLSNEQQAVHDKACQYILRKCHPEQLITETKFLSDANLIVVVSVLIDLSRPYFAPTSINNLQQQSIVGVSPLQDQTRLMAENMNIFFLEQLVLVVIQNKDRVHVVWPMVRDHLHNIILMTNHQTSVAVLTTGIGRLVERAVIALLRIAIRLMRNEHMSSMVLDAMQVLLVLHNGWTEMYDHQWRGRRRGRVRRHQQRMRRIATQIAFGLYELLKTSAQNIHTHDDWRIVFTLLECVGAGAQHHHKHADKCEEDSREKSGAKSDGEATPILMTAPRTSSMDTACPMGGYSYHDDDDLARLGPEQRGCTSDSELSGRRGQHLRSGDICDNGGSPTLHTNTSGSWILVGAPPVKSEPDVISDTLDAVTLTGQTDSGVDLAVTPLLDQRLPSLRRHDPVSLMKCCESLAFLVRDVAHITPYNFDDCIHCIRTFVEACLRSKRRRTVPSTRHVEASRKRATSRHYRQIVSSSDDDCSDADENTDDGNEERSLEIEQNSNSNNSEDDDDDDSDSANGYNENRRTVSGRRGHGINTARQKRRIRHRPLPIGYHQVPIQLLDLMHTLHTRTAQIFRWWAEESGSAGPALAEAQEESLWTKGWCPLLQGIARLCCDARRDIRMSAITYLQRALLVPDLRALTAQQWEACFHRVLFPLLAHLLQPVPPVATRLRHEPHTNRSPASMEETRIRAVTVLCKVFLHHLSPLISLDTFDQLWLTILDFVDRYMHAGTCSSPDHAPNAQNSGSAHLTNHCMGSDLLLEAVPESLKNMLLVMDAANVFDENEEQRTDINNDDDMDHNIEEAPKTRKRNALWFVTWKRIGEFLPRMCEELFPQEFLTDVADPTSSNIINSSAKVTSASPHLSAPAVVPATPALFQHLGHMVSTPIPAAPAQPVMDRAPNSAAHVYGAAKYFDTDQSEFLVLPYHHGTTLPPPTLLAAGGTPMNQYHLVPSSVKIADASSASSSR